MSKHTPGPWYVDGDYVSGVDIGNTEGTSIFYACCCGHVTGDSEQRTANARIIAAAPEMYELIKTGVRFLQNVRQYHPLSAAEEKWEQNARELLAEIEGGGNEPSPSI